MSAALFAAAVKDLLVNDTTFAGAVAALLGQSVTTVLASNQPLEQIPLGQFPCFIVEQGDGNVLEDSFTLGNHEMGFESDLEVALVWQAEDRTQAAAARSALATLFAQLLLRNPTPGGILSAWLQSWSPDRAALYPAHIWSATIRGQYTINRS